MSRCWAGVGKASEIFGVSERTFRGWLKLGFPHSRLPSGRLLIEIEAGHEWLRNLSVGRGDQQVVDEIMDGLK